MRFLIAFGPTQEPLDPVRFLSNRSTGTIGRYLVSAARKKGHRVEAVECPKDVQTARDLEKKLKKSLPKNDVLIMAAAVCDVRPRLVSAMKLKKDKLLTVHMVRNPDILAGLARQKKKNQIFIGFGLESEKVIAGGFQKLKQKNLELIVLHQVKEKLLPFGDRPVDAAFLYKDQTVKKWKALRKEKLARILIGEAERLAGRLSGEK